MGNWLTDLRLKAGYRSIRSLSADSKIDVSTLARIEKAVHVASPETLRRLAPYLKTPYLSLLGIAGHLDSDTQNQKLAADYGENPDAAASAIAPTLPTQLPSSIEAEWPEVIQVLRRAGTLPTPEERRHIARIIQAVMEEEKKEGNEGE